jgi:4-diphosphocytidyl-2-C-methyl-D-erythritol kinase
MTETAKAYAKVNISLDIISKMPDGYHEMLMIMQSVSLCDDVTVECVSGEGVVVETDLSYVPSDERNVAAKSAMAFFEHIGITGYKTFIKIKKRIPVAAGLGGGSADGACVLRLLNKMFNTELSVSQLEEIGVRVGADVPFCISGGTKIARGRGEILTDIAPLPPSFIVICKPPFAYSTSELFKRIRCEKIRARPDTEGLIAAVEDGDLLGIARRMYNVFEDFLPRGSDDIDDIKSTLHDAGALGVVMTGSGSSVFGLFDCEDSAKKAHGFLKLKYNFVIITKPQHNFGGIA